MAAKCFLDLFVRRFRLLRPNRPIPLLLVYFEKRVNLFSSILEELYCFCAFIFSNRFSWLGASSTRFLTSLDAPPFHCCSTDDRHRGYSGRNVEYLHQGGVICD